MAFFWRQFNDRFATEADCLEELYRRAADEGLLKCGNCGSTDIRRRYGARVGRCLRCKKRIWLTAGTFFHRMRAARPWLAAIWLMEQGVSCNSLRFQGLVDIAYSSALNIFKKLTMVIQRQMGEDAVVVPSSCFSRLVCRRSRETPARGHPLAEQDEIERAGDGAPDDSEVVSDRDGERGAGAGGRVDKEVIESEGGEGGEGGDEEDVDDLSEQEKRVYGSLSVEPIQFDDLCESTGVAVGQLAAALTMLELAGMVRRMPGDRYVSCRENGQGEQGGTGERSVSGLEFTDKERKAVDAIVGFVRSGFQGISRKYLQHYLAAYWCHVDRMRWQTGSLLQACLRSSRIGYDEILAYVSPVMVKISPR